MAQETWHTTTQSDQRLRARVKTSSHRPCAPSRSPTTQAEVCSRLNLSLERMRFQAFARLFKATAANGCAVSTGGAANAYIPTPEEEEREKKIQEQEAELIRVRTQSKDRVREIEQERQELRRDSPSS